MATSRHEEFPLIASETATRPRPADLSSVIALLCLLFAGPALGLFAWQSDRIDTSSTFNEVIRGLGNVPSPWLVLAFVTGAVLTRPVWGALAAATVLCIAVATYYYAITLSGDRQGIPLRGAMAGWLAVALIAGPAFGLAGSLSRSRPHVFRPIAIGVLTGALAGEVAYFGGDAMRYGLWSWSDTWTLLAVAEVTVAMSLPLLLLEGIWNRLQAYLTAALMGGVALIVMLWLDQVMLDVFNA